MDHRGWCCRRSEMKTWEILFFPDNGLGSDRVLKSNEACAFTLGGGGVEVEYALLKCT